MNRFIYEAELMEMAAALSDSERDRFISLVQAETQNPLVNFGWNMWLGFLGIDRFIVGDILAGFLKLITLGGFGIWVIIDCFLIGNRTRVKNMEKIHYIYDSIVKRSAFRED